ncbi:von Willebrand factor [Planctomycetes bacterium CA13]|uniref:von Willebrand factor n=1 Tax=Novipirellula herctigrandis TaxID=2527986 RepID=A0A5C5YYB6_9BACT|nr:von Willebrand factor [Planctomycetes bacterium CA13]
MSESLWNDPRITAYVLGELDETERSKFENEIHDNPALAAAVQEARELTNKLGNFYSAESTPPLDAHRREQIISAESPQPATTQPATTQPATTQPATTQPATTQPATQPNRSWYSPSVLKLVTAACVMFLLLGVVAPKIQHSLTNQQVAMQKTESAVSISSERQQDGAAADDLPAAVELAINDERASESETHEAVMDQPFESGPAPKPLSQKKTNLQLNVTPRIIIEEQEETAQTGFKPLDRSSLEQNRRRIERSQLLETDSAAATPPAIKVVKREDKTMDEGKGIGNKPASSFAYEPQQRAAPMLSKSLSVQSQPAAPAGDMMGMGGMEMGMGYGGGIGSGGVDMEMGDKDMGMMGGMDMEMGGMGMEMEMGGMDMGMDAMMGSGGMGMGGMMGGRDDSGPMMMGGTNLMYELPIDDGRGPGIAGDRFDVIEDNAFKRVSEHPMSTFSIDVDTASYSKVRDYLIRANSLPRPDAVRIEELVNYFTYDYEPPKPDAQHPFAARAVITQCPWNPDHRLARIALKGKVVEQAQRPQCNLVFLIDTSGSMNATNKLPLVQKGMKMLLKELNPNDRVAIVVYAGSAGLVLDSTKVKNGKKIRKALTQLSAGGSTNGGQGIALAYQSARDNFIKDGVNRVILCSDGDFNVGTTGTDALVRMVEKESKGGVFLSVLGFGMGNHNDAMLEQISGKGNGNYAFIDNEDEAEKVLVEQANGTLVTIAKDVKLQIEFNPTKVGSYRLIGYENRVLAKEDFNDDTKDAGEIGAGHTVTALYEIVPSGVEPDAAKPKVDSLKYQTEQSPTEAAQSGETMTMKLRYKQPDADESTLVEFPVSDDGKSFNKADVDTKFAAAVAGFGMQLRRSEYRGNWTLSDVIRVAESAKGTDPGELRAEFVELAQKASMLMGEE